MHMETQTKTQKLTSFIKRFSLSSSILVFAGCSFVELQGGAENIIFSPKGEGCELIKEFTAEVKTSTFFIERRPEAIAEELQTLAQNEAFAHYANAIWPSSKIEEGKQTFDILRCEIR